jgi:hypothetical protein
MSFLALASAEFFIGYDVHTVKVENVPFTWDGVTDRDTAAKDAAKAYLIDVEGITDRLVPIWITVTPAEEIRT